MGNNDFGTYTFNTVEAKVKKLQDDFNEAVKEVLSRCEDEVCIRVLPTYLSHVDINDGYPVQLNLWNDNIIEQPSFPVFGKGVKPL